MSAAERWPETRAQDEPETSLRHTTTAATAATGGEEQEDLPGPKYREEGRPVDAASAREEQHREMGTAGSAVGPLGLVMTDAQGRGVWIGGAIGGAIGAVLFGIVGALPLIDMDVVPRMLLFALAGLLGGATAGAVFAGSRLPELEGEATDSDLAVPPEQRRSPRAHGPGSTQDRS